MKGIQKKKRSKTVLDEHTGEYKRRHGYGGMKDDRNIIMVDAKPGDEPGFNPFAELKKEKRERVKANEKKRQKNLKVCYDEREIEREGGRGERERGRERNIDTEERECVHVCIFGLLCEHFTFRDGLYLRDHTSHSGVPDLYPD